MSLKRRCAGATLLVLLLAPALPARAGDTRTVLLPEVDAYFSLTETTRLFLRGSLNNDLSRDTTTGALGAHLDLTLMPILRTQLRHGDWEREKYLWVRVGYQLSGSLDDPDHGPTENRGILEATARAPLPWNLWLINRAIRLDEHWRIEPYYRREEVNQPSRSHVNSVGLVLKYFH